jgi:PLP dependent protein
MTEKNRATTTLEELRERLDRVLEKIAKSALRSGRSPEEIRLIAVSKTHPTEILRLAIAAGVRDLGENRVQEAEGKIKELRDSQVRWHMIGHLQSNKARRVVQLFDVVHSLDSSDLAERLNRICEEEERTVLPVLIEVKLGEEETKTGIREEELPALLETIKRCSRLKLKGLMTVPPYFEDRELVRPFFRRLRELRDNLRDRGLFDSKVGELSMGMSHDFQVAIEEGATMVRVGTAIFGERD